MRLFADGLVKRNIYDQSGGVKQHAASKCDDVSGRGESVEEAARVRAAKCKTIESVTSGENK